MRYSDEDREAALEEDAAALKSERRREWRVIDFLGLPPEFQVIVTYHEPVSAADYAPHFGAGIQSAGIPSALTLAAAIPVLRKFHAAGEILSVPRWKCPTYTPVWRPAECNYSRLRPGAEHVEDAEVELQANGTLDFRVRELSFWLRLPDGEREFVDVRLILSCLPQSWEHTPCYSGFSTSTGECTGVTLAVPPGLDSAYIMTSLGSRGSWRAETYWETVDQFLVDLRKAGGET